MAQIKGFVVDAETMVERAATITDNIVNHDLLSIQGQMDLAITCALISIADSLLWIRDNISKVAQDR